MDYRQVETWQTVPELKGLRDLPRPPKALFYRGEWKPEIFKNCVTVVGSRRMTEYGRRVIEKLIPPLVLAKKTIVSGFMYGVDQYAHQVTLESGGMAVGILGWGIANRLEEREMILAQKVLAAGGLLLSEWEGQKPMLWTFPARDRLVAAISQEIYVIEAAVKSGSLITADWGRKLGRRVWAVPGLVTSRTSEGTNMLIATGQAEMWVGETLRATGNELRTHTKDPLVKALLNEPLTANELARKMNKPVAEVGAQLSLLSVTGQIQEKGGKYYVE